MKREPVSSSNIKSVGYDPASKTLEVEFQSGDVHQFLDVPAEKHAELIKAKSIGGHFHKEIRWRHKSKKVGP